MKTLIISGGSSGIGEAIIHKFHEQNYHVYNLDLKDNERFADYPNYVWCKVDVTDEAQIISTINKITENNQIINVLIPNAGKHLSATIENTTSEQLQDILNLNLLSAYYLIKYSLPYMKESGGAIIVLGSDQSTIAKPNSTAYGMSKAALASLTKSIALDYAKYNIRANCIAAGTIDTPLYRTAIKEYAEHSKTPLEQIKQNEALAQPIGRIGQASEVAELAYFLAQDEVSYITGAVIPIDGGYTTR